MTHPDPAAGNIETRLGKLVDHELATLRDFLGTLQKEQHALIVGDLDTLTAQSAEKARLAALLADIAKERTQALKDAGLPEGHDTTQWLERQSATTSRIRAKWDSLLLLAKEARTINESNGTLIATRLQHNQRALAVLLSATDQAALYGPDGQTQTRGNRRLFGAA